MSKIKIKKSNCADTRTCDWSKVTKDELLINSYQHIKDVIKGIEFLSLLLNKRALNHDNTKLSHIDQFHEDFKTGFSKTDWWEMHQKRERHHFNNKSYIKDDIDLLDVIEQIVDGVMAGMARSGEYRIEIPEADLLLEAYKNTTKILLDNIEIEN